MKNPLDMPEIWRYDPEPPQLVYRQKSICIVEKSLDSQRVHQLDYFLKFPKKI
jgi:hypothetical protein